MRELFEESDRDVHMANHVFDFSFENHISDLISIKREAFNTILDFSGIERKTSTPTSKFLSEEERERHLRAIESKMMSPTANLVRKEFNQQIQQELEKQRNISEAPGTKKAGLFNRMRSIICKYVQ